MACNCGRYYSEFWSILHCGIYHNDDIELLRQIIKLHPDKVHAKSHDYGCHTPLHIASEKGNIPAILLLLETGANLEEPDTDGSTPLYISARAGQPDAVQTLLKAGADVHANGRNIIEVSKQLLEYLKKDNPKRDRYLECLSFISEALQLPLTSLDM